MSKYVKALAKRQFKQLKQGNSLHPTVLRGLRGVRDQASLRAGQAAIDLQLLTVSWHLAGSRYGSKYRRPIRGV